MTRAEIEARMDSVWAVPRQRPVFVVLSPHWFAVGVIFDTCVMPPPADNLNYRRRR